MPFRLRLFTQWGAAHKYGKGTGLINYAPLRQFWLAAVLLTRLPLPRLSEHDFATGARAVWAYPLVGLIVGGIGALVGQAALWFGLPLLAVGALAVGAMIVVTGAMHEDGLADVADGFWGGFTPARRLEIMRDSQIGTYGMLALLMVCILRLSAVMALLGTGWAALIAAAVLSRGMMVPVMYALPHARDDGLSHSVGAPSAAPVGTAIVICVITALVCLGSTGLVALLAVSALTAAIALIARRKIGGQTGDVLGAIQQLCEAAVLLACAAVFTGV